MPGQCLKHQILNLKLKFHTLSLGARIRRGINLGALVSTKGLDSAKDRTRVPDSTRDQVQDSVGVQTQASVRVQARTTTSKDQVGRTTTMATQRLLHPALMLS